MTSKFICKKSQMVRKKYLIEIYKKTQFEIADEDIWGNDMYLLAHFSFDDTYLFENTTLRLSVVRRPN